MGTKFLWFKVKVRAKHFKKLGHLSKKQKNQEEKRLMGRIWRRNIKEAKWRLAASDNEIHKEEMLRTSWRSIELFFRNIENRLKKCRKNWRYIKTKLKRIYKHLEEILKNIEEILMKKLKNIEEEKIEKMLQKNLINREKKRNIE